MIIIGSDAQTLAVIISALARGDDRTAELSGLGLSSASAAAICACDVAVANIEMVATADTYPWMIKLIENTSTLVINGRLTSSDLSIEATGDKFRELFPASADGTDGLSPRDIEAVFFRDSSSHDNKYGAHHLQLLPRPEDFFSKILSHPGYYWGWSNELAADSASQRTSARGAIAPTTFTARDVSGNVLASMNAPAGSAYQQTVNSPTQVTYVLKSALPECRPPLKLVCCDYRTGRVTDNFDPASSDGGYSGTLLPDTVCVKYYCE